MEKANFLFTGIVILFIILFAGCDPEDTTPDVTEYSISDPAEGNSPDFRELTIGVSTDEIIITIDFNTENDITNAGHFVYLYNTNNHMVSFDENTFELRLDSEPNGAFETLVYSGTVDQPESTQLQMTIPASNISDIFGKEVWGYSMDSTDRIPDSGSLYIDPESATPTPPPTVTEYSINDPAEGRSPDFRELTIGVSAAEIIITIEFDTISDIANAGQFVYLYNTNAHEVDFDENTFELRLDSEPDGLFETLVYSGIVYQTGSTQLQMTIPVANIPDIAGKEAWGYSMNSTDRIPDSGAVILAK